MNAFETVKQKLDAVADKLSLADYLSMLEQLRDEIDLRIEAVNADIERAG